MVCRKTNNQKPVSKHKKDAVIISATVNKIELLNAEVNGKLKSVFYCPSYYAPEGRMCVYWGGRTCVEVGDRVEMKGRYVDGVFLVWQLLVDKRNRVKDGN